MKEGIVRALLKSQLGKTADFHKYDRSPEFKSPINFFLNHVQKEIKNPFDVYWVENGLPELFSIATIKPPIAVYSRRYIELWYLMRRLMNSGPLDSFREELAERTCLRIMAELGVRYRDPDWAVRAFLKSILGQSIFLLDIHGASLLDLEVQPKNEAYTVLWFFGLAHELGHLYVRYKGSDGLLLFSREAAEFVLQRCLGMFPFSDRTRKEVLKRATDGDADYVLSIPRLISEASADFFGALQVMNVTILMMYELGKQVDYSNFMAEISLCWPILSILERCKRMALSADQYLGDNERNILALQPVSYAVRNLLIRPILESAIARAITGGRDPSPELSNAVSKIMNDVSQYWQPSLDVVEKGMAKAMRFALFPEERPADLMTQVGAQLLKENESVALVEIQQFCSLVESFHVDVEAVQALRRISEVKKSR